MSNATEKKNTTIRRAFTVAEAKKIDEALKVLKPKSVRAFTDGPWAFEVTHGRIPEGKHEIEIGHRADYDVERNSLTAVIDGERYGITPDRERMYGGDHYGTVCFEIEW